MGAICNLTKVLLILIISGFLVFTGKTRVAADAGTSADSSILNNEYRIGTLVSTQSAGFELLIATVTPHSASVNIGLNYLNSLITADLTMPKVEEAKGIEYYILDDRLAEKIDATRIQTLERDDYYNVLITNRLVLKLSWFNNNSRVARVWHMDIGALNNGIENSYPKLTYLAGGESLAKGRKLSEIEPKYMIDEVLAVKQEVFKTDCPSATDYAQKRFKVIGSFSVLCKYPITVPVLVKGIASGIVTLSDFDCNNAEDMDGIRVFVPAIKKGEVTTEQFKMQLKRNDAVLRGVVKTFERGQQIDPNFGRYSLLKAEPEVSDDVNFFDTDPSLPFLKRMKILFKFLKRSIKTKSTDRDNPIEIDIYGK
ncbi:MAG: hypothetical protein LBJ98_00825 [Endomicrobium sp.]|jgi:hypothetical protein|nr:hypothetical protein [Endomicrobium sp.]